MAWPHAWPRLLFFAAETGRAARIDNLFVTAFQIVAHGSEITDHLWLQPRREITARSPHRTGRLCCAAFFPPFRHAAVEHGRIGMTHRAHHPKRTRRGIDAGAIVEDDHIPVADT